MTDDNKGSDLFDMIDRAVSFLWTTQRLISTTEFWKSGFRESEVTDNGIHGQR